MSSDPTPPSSGPRHARNAGTMLPPAFSLSTASPIDLERAYQTARGVASMVPVAASGGHRIFWVRDGSFASAHLANDDYAVVGRHTHADVVLTGDASIALRHLLLRSVTLADGTPGLHALDLRTSLGMRLASCARPRAFFARGPVALGLGEYALIAIPNGIPAPDSLPEVDIDEAAEMPLAPYPAPLRVREEREGPRSQITLLPPISVIAERRQRPEPSYGDRTITLERNHQKATVDISQNELDRGVLIGRAEKCFDLGLRSILSEDTNISRVHALLLRERDAVFAFDLGSTQGTFTGTPPRRARRIPLTNAGATLLLGHDRKNRVELYWHPLH